MNRIKLDSLTSLRAFAAFLVVFQHTVGYEALSGVPILSRFPWDHGVSFFFVLSGFILTYVYEDLKPGRWYDFFVARIARIWPAHLFALGVGFLLGQYVLESKTILLINALMLQSWIPASSVYFSYNGVSWSISTELGFYLLFPLLILNFRHSWHWKFAIVFVTLIALLGYCVFWDIPGSTPENANSMTFHGLVYISPLARLMEFFIGMLTGLLFLSRQIKESPKTYWTILEAGVPLLAAVNSLWGIQWMMTPWAAVNEYVLHSGSVLSLALVVYVYAHQRGSISQFLSKPVFVFLGEISFSVYLLHVMLFWFIYRNFPEWDGAIRHLLFWPALLVVSSASYLLFEQPTRMLLRKLFSRKKTRVIEGDVPTVSVPEKMNQ